MIVARDLSAPVRLGRPSRIGAATGLGVALAEVGLGDIRGVPVFLPLHAGLPGPAVDAWCRAVEMQGGSPMVVARPIAAAAALGLAMAGRSHLMVGSEDGLVEASLVVDGSVTHSKAVDPTRGGWRTIIEALTAMLPSLDPDDELDVRDTGIHVFGQEVDDLRALAELAGLEVASPRGDLLSVTAGTQLIGWNLVG